MDWDSVLQVLPDLAHGLGMTFSLVILALLFGSTLAFFMAIICIFKRAYLHWPVRAFIFFIRGTPLLVQIFLIYYGSSQFTWLRDSIAWEFFKQPFACAVLALALNSAAYTAEIFIGAVRSIPTGEIIAAKSFGMNWWLLCRRIFIPRGGRIVLPAYANEIILLVKGSSLVSTITLLDLMGVVQKTINVTYMTMEWLCFAGMIYLFLNSMIMLLFRWVEQSANRYLT